MAEHRISKLECNISGYFTTDEKVYNAVFVVKYDIRITEKKTKELKIELENGDTLIYESDPKKLLGGCGHIGESIDAFDKAYPVMRKNAEESHKEYLAREQHMNDRSYGFLIADIDGLGKLCANTNFDDVYGWDNKVSRVLMMPCGIRGQRLLTLYHEDEKIRDAACDIIRKYYGDKIIREGRLSECEIDHGKRKMIKWEFMN